MSYDLMLFRMPADGDAARRFQQLQDEEEREVLDRAADWSLGEHIETERITQVLEAWRPNLVEFRPKPPMAFVQLSDEALELQFYVRNESVAVTIPYFRERANEMLEAVAGCMETLQAAAGYITFDPQLQRVVTTSDLPAMFGQYRTTGAVLSAGRKPWWRIW